MIQFKTDFLKRIIELIRVNTGRENQNRTNNYVRLITDNFKVRFETVYMKDKDFSGLSITTENLTGEGMEEYAFSVEKFITILDTFKSEGKMNIEIDEKKNVTFTDGKRKGKIPSVNILDCIPHMPVMGDESSEFVIPGSKLKEMISKVKHCLAPADEARTVLKGVFCELQAGELIMCCGDGKRIALDKTAISCNRYETYTDNDDNEITKEKIETIIPEGSMGRILKLITNNDVIVKTKTEGSMAGIEFYQVDRDMELRYFSSIISGRFPNYRGIIPDNHDSSMEIKKKPLVDILKNHKKFVDKLYKIDSHRDDDNFETILYLGEESLKLKSGHEDYGTLEDDIPVRLERLGFTTKEICINTKFLLEGSSEVYGDTVTVKIQNEVNPVVMTGGSFTSVVMPVRIKK